MTDAYGAPEDRLAGMQRLAVIQNLRQVGEVLDDLLIDATARCDGEAMGIADATQAVHRALVALT